MTMDQSITISAKGMTDIGRVRSANQDSYLINENQQLYIVADGMGGHAGGEIASQLCIQKIEEYILDVDPNMLEADPPPNSKFQIEMANAINFASSKIYEKALENPSLKGMGTTATALKIVDNHGYFAHVGDSRMYLVRSGFIFQVTHDHSLVSEQVRAGILTKEEAELHHLRNVITRSVGYQEEEDVDSSCFPVEDGDFLLLCSDGLSGKISDKELADLSKDKNLGKINKFIDLANERGGEDNITVILIKVQVS